MRAIKLVLSLIILIPIISLAEVEKYDLAITNVTIIDATSDLVQLDMTILITDNRIVKIDKSQNLQLDDSVQKIDGTNKYLIPGFWDMHVHWFEKDYLPLFIANGVTGFRVMWGKTEHFQWRKERTEKKLLCPRLEIGSPIIDGPNPMYPDMVSVNDPEEARNVVRQFKEEGYDFIKVLTNLPKPAFFAIKEECEKLEIPFAGHFPFTISPVEAVQAGLKSNEHLINILLSCSTQEEKFRENLTKLIADKTPWRQMAPMWFMQRTQYLETFDQKKADSLFNQIAKYNCWQCPTFTVNYAMANISNAEFKDDPRLKYMPSDIIDSWNKVPTFPPFITTMLKATFQKYLKIIPQMSEAGVRFLAGTDVINPFCFPGFSLHDELDFLVQSGLTPIEALQAATRNAAEYMGCLDSLGTIEEGKLADLVLLDANPIADIRNTTKINSVIFDGKVLNKAKLQKMLQDIETLANTKSEK